METVLNKGVYLEVDSVSCGMGVSYCFRNENKTISLHALGIMGPRDDLLEEGSKCYWNL